MNSRQPVTLICIGPMPNIAEALRREPRIAQHTRFVGITASCASVTMASHRPRPSGT